MQNLNQAGVNVKLCLGPTLVKGCHKVLRKMMVSAAPLLHRQAGAAVIVAAGDLSFLPKSFTKSPTTSPW